MKNDSIKTGAMENEIMQMRKWRSRLDRIESNHSELMREYGKTNHNTQFIC